MPTARNFLLATTAWLVTVGTLAWFGLGSFALTLIALSAGLWIGTPLLLIGLVLGLARHRAGWRLVTGVLGLTLTLGAGVTLGSRLCEWEVARAKAGGQGIFQDCQAHREHEGYWPENLAALGKPAPRLLRHARLQDGSSSLWIEDPRFLFGAWHYIPDTNAWHFSN
jgi:hypothetical protein